MSEKEAPVSGDVVPEALAASEYREMHRIATDELGYPSILEALEAAPHATPPQPEASDVVEAMAIAAAQVIADRHGQRLDDWLNDARREEMRAALSAARPIIERETLQAADKWLAMQYGIRPLSKDIDEIRAIAGDSPNG